MRRTSIDVCRNIDPAVLQKREELAVAREKLFLELSDRIQNNRLLDHPLTAAEMRDVLSHLKKIKRTDEGVPQGATRAKLQEILQRIWPDLHAFENDSVDAGATSRRRGPTGGDDKSREEEPPPLGCASCRGRPTGCDRCIAWRNEGRNQRRHRHVDFKCGLSRSWTEHPRTESTHNPPLHSKSFQENFSSAQRPANALKSSHRAPQV